MKIDYEIYGKVEKAVSSLPMNWQLRYCHPGKYGCCCLGCVNAALRQEGLTEADWLMWLENKYHLQPIPAEARP